MARRPTAASALDSPPSELVAELEVGAGWSLNNNNWLENGMHPVIFLVWNHHFFKCVIFLYGTPISVVWKIPWP
jgi:hypothetical protein